MATLNDVRVCQPADLTKYAIHEYKDYAGDNPTADLMLVGRSSVAPSISPVYLQIYNQVTMGWETIASNSTAGAGEDFTLRATVFNTTNYKSLGMVSCRAYQENL